MGRFESYLRTPFCAFFPIPSGVQWGRDMFKILIVAAVLLIGGCKKEDSLPTADEATIESSLKGVEQLVVTDASERTLRVVSDRQMMRSFVALLPKPQFDDIWGKTGATQYRVEFVGPGNVNVGVELTATHIRLGPKEAAKLSKERRTALLQALGLP